MRIGHISDDRLVALSLGEVAGPSEAEHLQACTACAAREAELAEVLADTSDAAEAAFEAAFPEARLSFQHAQIMRRLDTVSGPAQVIAFPTLSPATAGAARLRAHWTSRWVAVAAVAGLVVGIVAGRTGRPFQPEAGPSEQMSARSDAEPVLLEASTPDDQFLVELERAVEDGGAGSLRALDELTPRAWDR